MAHTVNFTIKNNSSNALTCINATFVPPGNSHFVGDALTAGTIIKAGDNPTYTLQQDSGPVSISFQMNFTGGGASAGTILWNGALGFNPTASGGLKVTDKSVDGDTASVTFTAG